MFEPICNVNICIIVTNPCCCPRRIFIIQTGPKRATTRHHHSLTPAVIRTAIHEMSMRGLRSFRHLVSARTRMNVGTDLALTSTLGRLPPAADAGVTGEEGAQGTEIVAIIATLIGMTIDTLVVAAVEIPEQEMCNMSVEAEAAIGITESATMTTTIMTAMTTNFLPPRHRLLRQGAGKRKRLEFWRGRGPSSLLNGRPRP